MAIQNDFTPDYVNKRINYTGGATTRYTVNAFYSWLMDLFDDAAQMDDTICIKGNTPTEYEFINSWTLGDGTGGSDATTASHLYGGSIKINATDDMWTDFYTLGTLEAGAVVYAMQNNVALTMPPGYVSGHLDADNVGSLLVKTRSAGVDVSTAGTARAVIFFARNWTDAYDHWLIQAPVTGGRNPVPLSTADDSNNKSLTTDIDNYTDITVTFGATTADINQDATSENYSVTVDCSDNTLAVVYEYLKYLTRAGETALLNSIQGQWYRGISGYTETKTAPFGTYQGGTFFGAKGVLLTNVAGADANNFILTANDGVQYRPPASISVEVPNVSTGDRVFAAKYTGTFPTSHVIVKNQYTLNGTHTNLTAITVNEAIANDTPPAGVIRIGDARYTYTGITKASKRFDGISPNVTATAGASAYCPFIDDAVGVGGDGQTLSRSFIYDSPFTVLAYVRQKGILPFQNAAACSGASVTIGAIRTTDPIAV